MPAARFPQLAKLTRPRLHSAIPRERLYRDLDAARQRSVTWVVGPPGAGKTTLVSTYLETAGTPTLWYQVDSGDDDPASFFYYLREAAAPLRKRRKPLPLLAPEYLQDVAGFARRFFRDLFAGVPVGAVLALDNFQEAAEGGSLHRLLVIAIEELPPETTVVVMSRTGPPAVLARALLGERVTQVTESDLRLDFEETRALAGRHEPLDEATTRRIFEQSNGWTAGVILLLERVRRDGVLFHDRVGATTEATFDYFASQIFDLAPAETRALLLALAWFPQVNAEVAQRVSGNAVAGQVLEFLFRQHLFVDRRGANTVTYQFHALFREFLQHRAERTLDADTLARHQAIAATELAESGAIADAVPLMLRAGATEAAARWLIRMAPGLIAQGRWQTFEDLVQQLPEEMVAERPWLCYWLGCARMAVAPARAEEIFEAGYEKFVARNDDIGAATCAGGVIEAMCFAFVDFQRADVWIERLGALLARGMAFEDVATEARIRSAVVFACAYRIPNHSLTRPNVARLLELLDPELELDVKVVITNALMNFAIMTADTDLGERVIPHAKALVDSPQATPHLIARCMGAISYFGYFQGRYDEAIEMANRALKIDRDYLLRDLEFHTRACLAFLYCRAGETREARALVGRLNDVAPTHTRSPMAFTRGLAGLLALHDGDPARAVQLGRESVAGADASASRPHFAIFRILLTDWALAAGDVELAASTIDELHGVIAEVGLPRYEAAIRMNEAHLAWVRGEKVDARRLLAEALALARERGGLLFVRWLDTALPRLLPLAIRDRVEVDIVRKLIRDYRAPSPREPVKDWNWPVSIETLGRFEVLVEGQPLQLGAKPPRRTLALLKAIIAFGGAQVPESRLLEALWPDLEGDAAHRALEAGVHRLRVLLRAPDVIRQKGGMLILDTMRCWVDARAFDFWAAKSAEDQDAADHALDLYGGAFLAEENQQWVFPERERLRSRFVRLVSRAAEAREAAGQLEDAASLYLRGLEADPLVESFYQGLMRCYGRLRRATEAAAVYRRMRQTLSVVLGISPSAASDRLFRETVYPSDHA